MSIYARRQPRSVHLAGVFNFPGMQVALDGKSLTAVVGDP
jgi:hypothetical protein